MEMKQTVIFKNISSLGLNINNDIYIASITIFNFYTKFLKNVKLSTKILIWKRLNINYLHIFITKLRNVSLLKLNCGLCRK